MPKEVEVEVYVDKGGRPSGFTETIAEKLLHLAKLGKTNAEIAEAIGINKRTLYLWQKNHPDFFHSVKNMKDAADELVEASLFRRACGYSHEDVKMIVHDGEILTQTYTKHYAPDTVAAIFWLKNRQPERWREKSEKNPGSFAENQYSIGGIPLKELIAFIKLHFPEALE